jgi:hypothetical protein
MSKEKGQKDTQTMIYKTLHRKLKSRSSNMNLIENQEWTQVLWKGKQLHITFWLSEIMSYLWIARICYRNPQDKQNKKQNIYILVCIPWFSEHALPRWIFESKCLKNYFRHIHKMRDMIYSNQKPLVE